MERQNAKFEAGKTYKFGWAGDADLFTYIVCIKRTAKTITFDEDGKIKTRRIKVDRDGEWIEPHGQYSMNPVCCAYDIVEA